MAQVFDVYGFGPAISIHELKPGEIAKISGNNGGKDEFVIGVQNHYVSKHSMKTSEQPRMVYAIKFSDGSFIDNSTIRVIIYPYDHYHLQLRPGSNI